MRWFVGAGVKHPFEYRRIDDICVALRLKGANKSTSIWPHDLNSDGATYTTNHSLSSELGLMLSAMRMACVFVFTY
jgi:hypothetical protein